MFRYRPAPSCPEYADVYNRLRSYDGRPLPDGQTAEALAKAGFFYIGKYTVHDRLCALSTSDIFEQLLRLNPLHAVHVCDPTMAMQYNSVQAVLLD